MSVAPSIPFFNHPALFERDEENFMGILRDVLRRGAFILKKDLAEFETALGVGPDDEVRRISDLIHAFYRGQE